MTTYSKEQTCKMFGISMERLNEQYAQNAQSLEQIHKKALQTGKKVNGYTAEQLELLTVQYWTLAQ